MSSDSGDCFPSTDHEHNHDNPLTYQLYNIVWDVTAGITGLTILLSIALITMHLRNYSRLEQQRYIIRILLMVPVYAMNAWLSLRFYWLSTYFDVLRECYEAYVIFSFYYLLIEYLGGYDNCKDILMIKEKIRLLPPLCFVRVTPFRSMMRMSMRMTLQYVIVRPATTFATLILSVFGKYCGDFRFSHGHIYILAIDSVSVTIAMFALAQFFIIFRDRMRHYHPGKKFIAVKFVVFLSFWQGMALSVLQHFGLLQPIPYWSKDNVYFGIQNLLIIFEMLIASGYHIYAFPYQEYSEYPLRLSVWNAIKDVVNPVDVFKHSVRSFIVRKKVKKVTNTGEGDEEEIIEVEEHIDYEDVNPNQQSITGDDFARYLGERGAGRLIDLGRDQLRTTV